MLKQDKKKLEHCFLYGQSIFDGDFLQHLIWWGTVALLCFTIFYPSVVLIIGSFKSDGGFGFHNYIYIFKDPMVIKSIINSMIVVLPVTLIGTVIGVMLAWIVARTDLPLKKVWSLLLVIPYLIPPFIGAIAWTYLLGPVGCINQLFMKIFNMNDSFFNIYSRGGMIFVMSIYKYTIPYIVVLPAIKKINASVEEAARISGASSLRTIKDIVIPLLVPSILGGMLLLFMNALADFGIAAVLGAPEQIQLMTTQIYQTISRPDLANNLYIAAANSIVLSMFGIIGLHLSLRLTKKNKYVVVSGKSGSSEVTRMGRWNILTLAILSIIFLSAIVAPLLVTLVTALTKIYGLPFSLSNITLNNFIKLFQIANIKRGFINSFFLAMSAGISVAVIGTIIAYVSNRKLRKGTHIVQTMVTIPYAVPGTIIALAMILAFANRLPVIGLKLYGTIWILLVAYLAKFMNLGVQAMTGAIGQINPSLEEASRICGATQIKSFKDIMFPLLRPSMFAAFFLVMMPALSEITLSALLWTVNHETIGVIVYAAQEEGKTVLTASLATLLILFVLCMNIIVNFFEQKKVYS